MSEQQSPIDSPELEIDQLSLLKQRAAVMGIQFSNNISIDTLKRRIQERLDDVPTTSEVPKAPVDAKTPTIRQYMQTTQMKLVRLRIQNLNPSKKDLQGEFMTVANEYLGTVTKFIPFGEATDEGYHVPYCLYQDMLNKQFLNIKVSKDKRTGVPKVETNWAREFALEVLPQLTGDELKTLAVAQMAAGNS